ncbi:2-phosphoglycerate kinase [Mycoplasmatota bacterium]|nr:2-phosphoglycerate kinase [Mycoplasmatota bacterium]
MIILIGGASCTGKTLMANNLMKKYAIPYFSLDWLKMGLYRSNGDIRFNPSDDDKKIESYLRPIVSEMIKTCIENNQSLIIEGCYILPSILDDFDDEYLNKIISVFLNLSENYLMNNFEDGVIKNRSVIESRNYKEDRGCNAFVKLNNELRLECVKSDINLFVIDSNYEEEIIEVYSYIEREINRIENGMD